MTTKILCQIQHGAHKLDHKIYCVLNLKKKFCVKYKNLQKKKKTVNSWRNLLLVLTFCNDLKYREFTVYKILQYYLIIINFLLFLHFWSELSVY